MKSIQYSIVDVFAQRKYTGNQLAVFKDAGRLSDKEMQQPAAPTAVQQHIQLNTVILISKLLTYVQNKDTKQKDLHCCM